LAERFVQLQFKDTERRRINAGNVAKFIGGNRTFADTTE